MNSENTLRTIELTVSRSSIIDKYAEWLAQTKVVLPNEEVKNIQFGELFGDQELVPIKVTITSNIKEESKPDQVLH